MSVVLPVKDTDELRSLISLKGETVRSFSLKHGISYGYLSQILNGREPSPKMAKKISDGVGKPIDSIFLFTGVAKSKTR
ncbi:helix-turn-helix domain-containing protein [Lactiplantibacillus nangangensis]|uniref:Helix-turn-helix domain-containing protein n=1 Tax=Lactiplantibacillus nangangensis TaxID=2559917 RepID=A0ABW1SLX2_9LACO|nr:helix-turn-helix transcriptional regulator [Lactiplantibacillus nangangensis]